MKHLLVIVVFVMGCSGQPMRNEVEPSKEIITKEKLHNTGKNNLCEAIDAASVRVTCIK